jgi:recombination protein RecA
MAKDLKKLAQNLSQYINNQYKDAVSYAPETSTLAAITVSKWLELSKPIQEATELPGLPFGNITCVYGKPDTGKTTLLMEAIAACQRNDILPILILSEHKFDFTRLSSWMDADPEALLVIHTDTLEAGYSFIEKILKDLKNGKLVIEKEEGDDLILDMTDNDCFIMWDSIGNTLSTSQLEYETEDWSKNMGKHAQAIKALTKRVNHLLSKVRSKCGILFLNQSYTSMPSYGPPVETPYGGDGVPYSSALVLRTRRKMDLKMASGGKDSVIGLETLIEVKKNHITHKKLQASVYTVASGMIPATKTALDEYKKFMLKKQKEMEKATED